MKERWYNDQKASVWMRWTRCPVQLLSDDARRREENAGDAEGLFGPSLSHATLCSIRPEDTYGEQYLWSSMDAKGRGLQEDEFGFRCSIVCGRFRSVAGIPK
jgi:hypothetical protein